VLVVYDISLCLLSSLARRLRKFLGVLTLEYIVWLNRSLPVHLVIFGFYKYSYRIILFSFLFFFFFFFLHPNKSVKDPYPPFNGPKKKKKKDFR
jgi:hypothetical protein